MLAYAITKVSEFGFGGGCEGTGEGGRKRCLGLGWLALARGLCVIEFMCWRGVEEVLVGV